MSINLNGSDIDTENIANVYLDLKRNITVTLKDNTEILIQKSERWKDVYEKLTGHSINE